MLLSQVSTAMSGMALYFLDCENIEMLKVEDIETEEEEKESDKEENIVTPKYSDSINALLDITLIIKEHSCSNHIIESGVHNVFTPPPEIV